MCMMHKGAKYIKMMREEEKQHRACAIVHYEDLTKDGRTLIDVH